MTPRPRDDPAMTPRPRGADDHAVTTTRPTPPRRGGRGRRRGQGSHGREVAEQKSPRGGSLCNQFGKSNEGRSSVQKPAKSSARVKPGKLVLICDLCAQNVDDRQGFLTVRERKLRIYHDYCAATHGVVCEGLPGATGGRPCKINTSQIATADLLLSALATLSTITEN